MNDVLHDFSDAALTAANEANQLAYYDVLGRSTAPIVDYHDGPDFKWLVTGLSHAFFNQVWRALPTQDGEDQPDLEGRVADLLAHFSGHGVQHLMWRADRDGQPRLGACLEAHGFAYAAHGLNMALDLQQLDDTLVSVPGLSIEQVNTAGDLQVWMDTAFAGFDVPMEESPACCEMYSDMGFDRPMRAYLGRWNGRPVATSQLFLGEGVAGIYCVATLEEARRRGIGAAMTMAPLLEARDMGYRVGILQASSMGASVYRRMGFREHSSSGFYYLVQSQES